jgi:hypothetical protein
MICMIIGYAIGITELVTFHKYTSEEIISDDSSFVLHPTMWLLVDGITQLFLSSVMGIALFCIWQKGYEWTKTYMSFFLGSAIGILWLFNIILYIIGSISFWKYNLNQITPEQLNTTFIVILVLKGVSLCV